MADHANRSEPVHDVLAADMFPLPYAEGREPAGPHDVLAADMFPLPFSAGVEPAGPHDVLAADMFPLPYASAPSPSQPRRGHRAAAGAALAAGVAGGAAL